MEVTRLLMALACSQAYLLLQNVEISFEGDMRLRQAAAIIHFWLLSAATRGHARTIVQSASVRTGIVWGVQGAQAACRCLTQGISAAGPVACRMMARLYVARKIALWA